MKKKFVVVPKSAFCSHSKMHYASCDECKAKKFKCYVKCPDCKFIWNLYEGIYG